MWLQVYRYNIERCILTGSSQMPIKPMSNHRCHFCFGRAQLNWVFRKYPQHKSSPQWHFQRSRIYLLWLDAISARQLGDFEKAVRLIRNITTQPCSQCLPAYAAYLFMEKIKTCRRLWYLSVHRWTAALQLAVCRRHRSAERQWRRTPTTHWKTGENSCWIRQKQNPRHQHKAKAISQHGWMETRWKKWTSTNT